MAALQRVFALLIATSLFLQGIPTLPARAEAVEDLAAEIDSFEKDLEKWGYVLIKRPDIWGQARFTQHRVEFEDVMKNEKSKFAVKLQGAQSDADSAMAAMALSIQAALPGPQAHIIQPYEMMRRYQELKRQDVMDQNYGDTTTVTNDGGTTSDTIGSEYNLEDEALGLGIGANATSTTNTNNSIESTTNTPEKKVFPTRLPERDVIDVPDGTAAESLISGFDIINRHNTLAYAAKGFGSEAGLGLEPSLILDQHARYLNHLHALRRINEGDDNADAPGYNLYLVRVPVSIKTSAKTQKGYGARVTLAIQPTLGERFMENSFRDFVINDLLEQIVPTILRLVNDKPKLIAYRKLAEKQIQDKKGELKKTIESNEKGFIENAKIRIETAKSEEKAIGSITKDVFKDYLSQEQLTNSSLLPGTERIESDLSNSSKAFSKTNIEQDEMRSLPETTSADRSAPTAYPMSDNAEVFHPLNLLLIADELESSFASRYGQGTQIQATDVRAALRAEVEAAYQFLERPEKQHVWDFCQESLIDAVSDLLTYAKDGATSYDIYEDARQRKSIDTARKILISKIGDGTGKIPEAKAILAWGIIVHAAIMNQRMIDDIRDEADSNGNLSLPPDFCFENYKFFIQYAAAEAEKNELKRSKLVEQIRRASRTYNDYVQAKWPTYVFALDPMSEDQNILHQYSARRELQMAMAVSLASGWIKGQAVQQYARRLERDMETVSLNRTIVGFAYGEETFGWDFLPRFQTPDPESNLEAFARNNFLGMKARDALKREWHLENGPRECVAVVVMPSFIRDATMDVRSEWFPIGKQRFPKGITDGDFLRCEGPSLKKALRLSKAFKNLDEQRKDALATTPIDYRNVDRDWLVRYADRLEDRLPIQSIPIDIPYDRTTAGLELFDSSSGALAPELEGWYGGKGLDLTKGGTFFLTGRHFNTLSSEVIINGTRAPATLMSREVLKVSVAAGLKVEAGQKDAEIWIATPYGVSRSLRIPVYSSGVSKEESQKTGFAWDDTAKPIIHVKFISDSGNKDVGNVDTLNFQADTIRVLKIVRAKDPAGNPDQATVSFTLFSVAADGSKNKLGEIATPLPVSFTAGTQLGVLGSLVSGVSNPSSGPVEKELLPMIKNALKSNHKATTIRCEGTLVFGDIGKSLPVPIDNSLDIAVVVSK